MTESMDLSRSKCLVVDENGHDRETLRRILAEAGAEVVEAPSGPRGLAEATRARTAGRAFDLLFVAATMSPIDGIELAEHLKAHPKEFAATILMVGPSHVTRDLPRAAALGLSAHISKPLIRPAIFGAIAAARGAPTTAAESGRATLPRMERLRILLAEDTTDVGWVIRAMIEGPRFAVDLAANGGIAVDLFRMVDYDLVLMDLQMPDFDGYWAAREIRKWEHKNRRKRAPIVAVTAYLEESPEKVYAAGFDGHLLKPFEKPALLKLIERVIDPERRARP